MLARVGATSPCWHEMQSDEVISFVFLFSQPTKLLTEPYALCLRVFVANQREFECEF